MVSVYTLIKKLMIISRGVESPAEPREAYVYGPPPYMWIHLCIS